jgi:hypothetical protein
MKKKIETFISENIFETFKGFINKLRINIISVYNRNLGDTESYVKHIELEESDFVFNGESFYYIGRGHSFGFGFYEEYVTFSGILGRRYASGNWLINSDSYDYVDNEFVLIQKKPRQENPLDESSLNFTIIKQNENE